MIASPNCRWVMPGWWRRWVKATNAFSRIPSTSSVARRKTTRDEARQEAQRADGRLFVHLRVILSLTDDTALHQ